MKHTFQAQVALGCMLFSVGCTEQTDAQTTEQPVTNAAQPSNGQSSGKGTLQGRPIPPKPFGTNKTPPTKGPNNGPPNLPGSSPSEDLSSSWTDRLAVSAKPDLGTKPSSCPDVDGDGFVDAKVCGDWIDINQADCDDSNPSVTPATERYIPSGRFIMGSASSHAGADEAPVHVVHLDGYCVDVDEVNVSNFADWLNANKRLPAGNDVRSLTVGNQVSVESGRENHPAEGVTWLEASNFCQDQGKSLPTEAQWEKAARGGCELGADTETCDKEDLRAYPWGSEAPSCEFANHQLSASGLPKLCVSDTLLPTELEQGKGPYGHRHLAGNIWEYVADVWHPTVYTTELRHNPAGPKSGDVHVLRGGGWNTFSTNMRVANRFHDLIMGSASGFRCARSFTPQQFDDVEPLVFSTIEGSISSTRPLKGRALYVTAFDANDADSRGMLIPGRSPIAETRLTPNEETTQSFSLNLPHGSYILSAALDAGTGANKDDYVSASGSGGFGHAKENPIQVSEAVSGIQIELRSAPMMMAPNKPNQPNQQGMPTPSKPSNPMMKGNSGNTNMGTP